MARKSRKVNPLAPAAPVVSQQKIFRTALYVRLSVADNGKEDGDSIETQTILLRDFVQQHPELVETRLYVDNGFTGTNFGRPEFETLIEDMKAGRIDCIVAKDLSRIGRNYLEMGNFIEYVFPSYQIRFISVNDHYDNWQSTPSGDMVVPLKNLVNELYAKDISRKVRSAMQGKIHRGEFIGDYAPHGYLKDPENKNHLIPDPETAPVIRLIYELRSQGMSYDKILKYLNDRDIPSPGRYRFERGIFTNNNQRGSELLWKRRILKDVLGNRLYIGDMVQGKAAADLANGIPLHVTQEEEWIMVPSTHEPIVDRELFFQVQAINMKAKESYLRSHTENKSNLPKMENPYGKKLRCGDCGYMMKMTRAMNTARTKAYYTYRCSDFVANRGNACNGKRIRKPDLDDAVLVSIQTQIAVFVEQEAHLKELNRTPQIKGKRKQLAEQLKSLERQLQRAREDKSTLYMDFKEGILTEWEYHEMRSEFSEVETTVQQSIEDLKSILEGYQEDYDACSKWVNAQNRMQENNTVTKELVDLFIEQILVFEDSSIKIQFAFEDEMKRLNALCQLREEEAS